MTSSTALFVGVAILLILRTVFALEEADKFNNFVNKKTVVLVNDEIVVDKKLYNDTVNIYVNSHVIDSVEVNTTDATITIDTLQP